MVMLGFRNFLEMSSHHMDKIAYEMEKRPGQLPLDNMFKGKLRVIVPLMDNSAEQLASELRSIGFEPDFKTGMATKTIKTKQGPKKTDMKIGKAISFLKSKHWEEFWNKNSGTVLKTASDPEGYSIIITRSPVDVLRMSDFNKIKSCHSEGGSYFKCAIQEAKTGGAIAYLVQNSDLNNLNINAKEIFEDNKRGVSGIKPVGRIRIRRFADEYENTELGIPEKRIYGKNVTGFAEIVKAWAKGALADTLKGKRPDMDDFKYFGGSYTDNVASTLFNNFFDDEQDSGDAEYGDEGEHESHNEQMRREMREIDRDYNHNWDNPISVTWDEDDTEDVTSFFWSGQVEFSFPRHLFTVSKINLSELIRSFNKISKSKDNYSSYRSEVKFTNSEVIFELDVEPREYGHPDEYQEFLIALKDLDKVYEKEKNELSGLLIDSGYMIRTTRKFDNLVGYEYESTNFENFYMDSDSIQSYEEKLFDRNELLRLINQKDKEFDLGYITIGRIRSLALMNLRQWWNKVMAANKQQPSLPGFNPPRFKNWMRGMVEPDLELRWQYNELVFYVSFPFSNHMENSSGVLRGIRFLDTNWDRVVGEIKKAVYNTFV